MSLIRNNKVIKEYKILIRARLIMSRLLTQFPNVITQKVVFFLLPHEWLKLYRLNKTWRSFFHHDLPVEASIQYGEKLLHNFCCRCIEFSTIKTYGNHPSEPFCVGKDQVSSWAKESILQLRNILLFDQNAPIFDRLLIIGLFVYHCTNLIDLFDVKHRTIMPDYYAGRFESSRPRNYRRSHLSRNRYQTRKHEEEEEEEERQK